MRLQVENISFGYRSERKILDNLSLAVEPGEVLGILGPNGTGKTTLLKCINRILTPQSGRVLYGEQDMAKLRQAEIARIVAYVPQYSDHFFAMQVVDAVMLGRLPYAARSYSKEDERIVFGILQDMRLEPFAFRNLQEMSGGERQRVFIARAMAQQPRIIALDEPTSSLDLHNQLFILHTIADLAKMHEIGVIMTIHDLNLASMFCDKLLMLKDAKLFAYGYAQAVLDEASIQAMYRVRTRVTMEDGYKHVRLRKELETGGAVE